MAGLFRRFTKGFFVLCNIGVGLLFLLGCYAHYFNQETFWFLGLLTLGSLYLLLILFIFIIFWFIAKKKFMLISIISILLAWVPMGHIFKFRIRKDFALQKDAAGLRVMSWNVEHFDILEHKTHPEKKQAMLDLVNLYQPDIACFQEMVGSDRYPNAINYLPAFAERMQFPDYFYSFNHKLDFDDKHHFGIVIYSRLPVIRKETVSYPPHDYNSIFQYIDVVKGADTFRIFNIHLQSLKFTEANREYIDDPTLKSEMDLQKSKNIISKMKAGFAKRKVQSERIKEAMNASPYPVIVCGDFNDVPNSYAYSTIGKGMKNCFAEKGSGIGRTFSSISSTLRIDNIFTDPRFHIEQFTRVSRSLSDHFPVLADMSYER